MTAYAAQGLLQCSGVAGDAAVKVVFGRERFSASDAVPIAAGVVGAHRSRRRGEGTDLAGVRPFVPVGTGSTDQLAGVAAHRRTCT